jgi:hypothetical protein
MKLRSQMNQEEWFRCIDVHFDSTAALAKAIALLHAIADDDGRPQGERDQASAEAIEAQRDLSLEDARWKLAQLGERSLEPPTKQLVDATHALSKSVATLNAATAKVAAVVKITDAIADALQKVNETEAVGDGGQGRAGATG